MKVSINIAISLLLISFISFGILISKVSIQFLNNEGHHVQQETNNYEKLPIENTYVLKRGFEKVSNLIEYENKLFFTINIMIFVCGLFLSIAAIIYELKNIRLTLQ